MNIETIFGYFVLISLSLTLLLVYCFVNNTKSRNELCMECEIKQTRRLKEEIELQKAALEKNK